MGRLGKSARLFAATVALIGGFEGLRFVAYRDGGGVPTICYGATEGVRMGDRATRPACEARLRLDLARHEAAMRACLTRPDDLPEGAYLAFLDLAFNVGPRAFCASTLARLANAGDVVGACNQLPRWVKDNGKTVAGLVNRRAQTQRLCLEGVK